MAANTIPYIGSKISLISNSEIRYEGILYTINTQESTIALQSVKTFGTEGRKVPEIPASSEIYDFIIFRGQDIKDLTVLEGAQGGQSSAMLSDPAIMSMNQRPSGGKGKDNPKGGGKGDSWQEKGKGKDSGKGWNDRGDSGKGWHEASWGQQSWGGGGGKGDGWGKGVGKWNDGGKGRADSYSGGGGGYGGKGKDYYAMDKGRSAKGGMKGGKYDSKGYAPKGKDVPKGKGKGDGGKGGSYGKGKDSGKGDNRRSGKGGNRSGVTASGVPVGELLPEVNADSKKAYAEDFDLDAAATKFEKVTESTETQPLSGYNKTSSFFDNISCEATDRAGDNERQKIDREKARQFDKDTFGDTRRPPRPVGVRRGKGKGGKGN